MSVYNICGVLTKKILVKVWELKINLKKRKKRGVQDILVEYESVLEPKKENMNLIQMS